jgi:hypothetical protein
MFLHSKYDPQLNPDQVLLSEPANGLNFRNLLLNWESGPSGLVIASNQNCWRYKTEQMKRFQQASTPKTSHRFKPQLSLGFSGSDFSTRYNCGRRNFLGQSQAKHFALLADAEDLSSFAQRATTCHWVRFQEKSRNLRDLPRP